MSKATIRLATIDDLEILCVSSSTNLKMGLKGGRKMKKNEIDILQACYQGNIKIVKDLLGQDPTLASTVDSEGEEWEKGSSTLALACCDGHIDIINELLAAGAPVDPVGQDGTPLLNAAYFGHTEAVDILLKAGADPNISSASGETPLLAAALGGYVEIGKLLIEKGANINSQTSKGTTDLFDGTTPPVCGETLLHFASAYGHKDFLNLLLENGADKNIMDQAGQKPIHWATRYRQKETLDLLKN